MSESKDAAKGNECLFCAEENRKALAFDGLGDMVAIGTDTAREEKEQEI